MSLKEIAEEIKKHDYFLITSHVNLEGDALGSELAFYRLLKALNKNAVIVNEDNVPYGYDFLPDISLIKKFKPELKGVRFDCVAVLDCSDLKRTGQVHKLNTENKPVFNIDHHVSNALFGDFNWIKPKASSCCEMIYQLYKKLKVRIDKEAALSLYTGILTDSGSFRYSNTSSFTHRIAADLLRHDFNAAQIYKNIFGNLPFRDLKLVIKVLSGIRLKLGGKIVWCQLESALLKKYEPVRVDLTDSVMNYARSIKNVEVAVFFKENLGVKNEVRVNFRSEGDVDVNKIAQFFGGGGHKTASGCTIHGKMEEVRSKVIGRLEDELEKLGL